MDPRLFDIVWEVRREVGSRRAASDRFGLPRARDQRHAPPSIARRRQELPAHGGQGDGLLPARRVDGEGPRDRAAPPARRRRLSIPRPTIRSCTSTPAACAHWPRMTRDQLARVFPDGKTVHIPTDGKPHGALRRGAGRDRGHRRGRQLLRRCQRQRRHLLQPQGQELLRGAVRRRGGRRGGSKAAVCPQCPRSGAHAGGLGGANHPIVLCAAGVQRRKRPLDTHFGNTTISPSRPSARIAPAPVRQAVQPEPDPEPVAQPTVVASPRRCCAAAVRVEPGRGGNRPYARRRPRRSAAAVRHGSRTARAAGRPAAARSSRPCRCRRPGRSCWPPPIRELSCPAPLPHRKRRSRPRPQSGRCLRPQPSSTRRCPCRWRVLPASAAQGSRCNRRPRPSRPRSP